MLFEIFLAYWDWGPLFKMKEVQYTCIFYSASIWFKLLLLLFLSVAVRSCSSDGTIGAGGSGLKGDGDDTPEKDKSDDIPGKNDR